MLSDVSKIASNSSEATFVSTRTRSFFWADESEDHTYSAFPTNTLHLGQKTKLGSAVH